MRGLLIIILFLEYLNQYNFLNLINIPHKISNKFTKILHVLYLFLFSIYKIPNEAIRPKLGKQNKKLYLKSEEMFLSN